MSLADMVKGQSDELALAQMHLMAVAHSPVRNYAIPGLTSWLIGAPQPLKGCVRMFVNDRAHVEPIIPHSHRFDFRAFVVRGEVTNRLWVEDDKGDLCNKTRLVYDGAPGHYEIAREPFNITRMRWADKHYRCGEWYGMRSEEIHSIYFTAGAMVLFFEGPCRDSDTVVLEPVVRGKVIPTFKVEPWMFQKGEPEGAVAAVLTK